MGVCYKYWTAVKIHIHCSDQIKRFSAQGKISGVIQKKKKKYLAGFWKSIFVFRVMLGKQHKNELKSIKFPCLEQEEN